MKLILNNVGPFKTKQEIQMNGITVFAGLNGTGKSTFGKTLFCIFSTFCRIEEMVEQERIRSILRVIVDRRKVKIRINYFNREMAINAVQRLLKETKSPEIEKELDELIYKLFPEEWGESSLEDLKNQIMDIIRVDDSIIRETLLRNAIENEFGNQMVNIDATEAQVELQIKDDTICFSCEKGGNVHIQNWFPLVKNVVYFDDPNVINYINSPLVLMNEEEGHRLDLIRKLRLKKGEEISSVDQVIIQNKIKAIEEKINEVCDGDVLESDGRPMVYQSKRYPQGLNLLNVATGMKSFATIKMLLKKGCLEENGVIILDEPEIHLHPEWQRQWAEIIVLLQKEFGINILLSTHSSDFLGFLELFIHKHKIPEKTTVYMLSNTDDIGSEVKEIKGNWEPIFKQLGEPFVRATEEAEEYL